MRTSRGRLLCALALCLASGLALQTRAQHHNKHDERALEEDPRLAPGQIAPVLEGLGDVHMKVTAGSERAQQFFDQGLALTYAFNHQEALRAFKEAARLDPDCAMAYWGWALVLGPNLNLPMRAEVVAQAHEAIGMAVERRDKASAQERGFIDALALRYTDDAEADRAPLDKAYADAMRGLHRKYPDDSHGATLYAAALMNLSPWNYWTRDRRPRANTEDVISTLRDVIERDPNHTGALHYYIHIIEPAYPERGLEAADLLRGLAPGAGHLVHMPSHIYMQLGRYDDSYEDNALAAKADEGYITQCRAQGMYPLTYYPHNVHFLAWAAIMQGRNAAALEAARKVASKVPDDRHGNDWGLYQTFLSMPLYTMTRFGQWEQILREPKPTVNATYWTGIWHYARGMAYTHTDRLDKTAKELEAIEAIVDDAASSGVMIGFSNAKTLLTIARDVLAGELAAKRGRFDVALGYLERAVRFEDSLLYNEPPDWYYPVRHTLGAVLIEAGRPDEAEVVYWQDLRKHRDNGFALLGLKLSLLAQGKEEAAAEISIRLQAAWASSDFELDSSRF